MNTLNKLWIVIKYIERQIELRYRCYQTLILGTFNEAQNKYTYIAQVWCCHTQRYLTSRGVNVNFQIKHKFSLANTCISQIFPKPTLLKACLFGKQRYNIIELLCIRFTDTFNGITFELPRKGSWNKMRRQTSEIFCSWIAIYAHSRATYLKIG